MVPWRATELQFRNPARFASAAPGPRTSRCRTTSGCRGSTSSWSPRWESAACATSRAPTVRSSTRSELRRPNCFMGQRSVRETPAFWFSSRRTPPLLAPGRRRTKRAELRTTRRWLPCKLGCASVARRRFYNLRRRALRQPPSSRGASDHVPDPDTRRLRSSTDVNRSLRFPSPPQPRCANRPRPGPFRMRFERSSCLVRLPRVIIF